MGHHDVGDGIGWQHFAAESDDVLGGDALRKRKRRSRRKRRHQS